MNQNQQIINDFILMTTERPSPLKTLILNFSTPSVLNIEINGATEIKNEFDFTHLTDKKFDLIVGDLPFGMQPVTVDTVSKLRVNKNWGFIYASLKTLQQNGKADRLEGKKQVEYIRTRFKQ